MNSKYYRSCVVDDVLCRLVGRRKYELMFSKRKRQQVKTEEDILSYWSVINPKLIDLIDEFDLYL